MAYEIESQIYPFEGGSTALAQYTFVAMSSTRTNTVVAPAAGAAVIGVMVSDYPSSTELYKAVSVQTAGIAKVSAPASTVSFGDLVSASTAGQVKALGAGDYAVGRVVDGSSGGAGRILSVLLMPIGTT